MIVSHTPLSGDLAWNGGVCPVWESNPQPFGSQAGTQSTDPHQPSLKFVYWPFKCNFAFYLKLLLNALYEQLSFSKVSLKEIETRNIWPVTAKCKKDKWCIIFSGLFCFPIVTHIICLLLEYLSFLFSYLQMSNTT